MLDVLQRQLRNCARSLYRQGMQTSDGGNISMRLEGERMLIKGSNSSFSRCAANDFVIADLEGHLIAGPVPPSKESPLHGAIYRHFAAAKAIVHTHSPYATACAAVMDQLVFSTYHSKYKLGDSVRVFDTGSYSVAPAEVGKIVSGYEPGSTSLAFLLRRHGLVAVGKSLPEAQNIAELLEETAKIHVLSRMAGGR
jgi:L-ribulose-5-phosphate 4-epimerase